VTFPDLNAKGGELNQTNLILPEPSEFLHKNLPACSVVRPTLDRNAGAVAAIKGFTADRLFEGQSAKFFNTVRQLAREADAAQRQLG
jgi:Ethanolamine utilization protein EutJ (predicted chaperonin)